jgi:hypothetical protein
VNTACEPTIAAIAAKLPELALAIGSAVMSALAPAA